MKIARVALLGLVLVLPQAMGPARAAEKIERLAFDASAWIEVDAAGHARVEGIERISKLGDVEELAPVVERLKGLLTQRIQSWDFFPATVDGVAAPSRTHLSVDLEAFDDGHGGMAVRILEADTGAKLMPGPLGRLISAMMMSGGSGRAVVDFDFDANGAVKGAELVESAGISQGRFDGRLHKDLARAVMAATRNWRVEPETVAGRAVPGSGHVPVWFCLDNDCGDLRDEAGETDTRLADADPAVRLRSDVAGTIL